MAPAEVSTGRPDRRRFVALVWLGCAGATVVMALSVANTMSGFSASVSNTTNTAGTGTLIMEEDQAATTCLSSSGLISTANAGSCATINKFGGNTAMVPGVAVITNITIKNNGSMPARSFTLTPGTCSQSANGSPSGAATDFCAKLTVVITSGASTVFTGTAAALAAGGAISLAAPVAAGDSVPFSFSTTVNASVDNSYQGLLASEPLTWTFAS